MIERDLLAEIRAIRDELAARYNCDAWALARAMTERSRAAGRKTVSFPPRPPAPSRVVPPPPPQGSIGATSS